VRVFSPTKENREAFVRKMSPSTDAKLRAVSSPEEAALGADIVSLATNSLEPFFSSAWISDGMHITTVRPSELTLEALVRCDLIAVSTREAAKLFTLPGEETNVPEFGRGDYGRAELADTAADWRSKPELSEIMAGKTAGRSKEADVTCMLNHLGLGLQFSAAAARVYELAKARGLGRELPGEWFCQSEHS
jgi:ornithine cyclodeaminase/alanine dehydrogenase-like protein (mu-crystallin family)